MRQKVMAAGERFLDSPNLKPRSYAIVSRIVLEAAKQDQADQHHQEGLKVDVNHGIDAKGMLAVLRSKLGVQVQERPGLIVEQPQEVDQLRAENAKLRAKVDEVMGDPEAA